MSLPKFTKEFTWFQWHLVLVIHLLGIAIVVLVFVLLFMLSWMKDLSNELSRVSDRVNSVIQDSVVSSPQK
jgi:hypothetical protein